MHVVPPKRWFGGIFGTPDSLHNVACEHAATALKHIADSIDTTRIPHISTGVMEGTAARTIARAARELKADLLVIGARGEHQ
ncbi:universal stress protein, partial [Acinetobacter baumannii]